MVQPQKRIYGTKSNLLTTDDQLPSIPGVNLRINDTISAVAALDDYYAYDDGTWEYAQQIRQREQIAVRFITNKPDAIKGCSGVYRSFHDQSNRAIIRHQRVPQQGRATRRRSVPAIVQDTVPHLSKWFC